jgi:hypothetical protein
MNPARNRVSSYRPARVTVAILVYLPVLEGYWQHRLDVLRLCFASLIRHTDAPYDLLVFDNGSCPEAKEFLRELQAQGAIRYLLTAHENIGKAGALKIIFGAAPGEVIAYADDDIFFYPGWLGAHLRLLDGFPNVGMVSGCAVRTLFDHGTAGNLRFAETEPEAHLTRGKKIPLDWEADWAESYGRDVEEHKRALETMEDLSLEYRGIEAFAIANHNQFLTPRSVILRVLPEAWSGRLMGEMNELDNAVANLGFLRLSTVERTTRHIGNLVSPAMAEEARRFSMELEHITPQSIGVPRPGLRTRLLRLKPVRFVLQGLYNRLFWVLSDQSGSWLRQDGGGGKP